MEEEKDQFFGQNQPTVTPNNISNCLPGMSLREMIHDFKYQTLVLFKCLLLQPKVGTLFYPQCHFLLLTKRQMLFFGSNCERLCMIQFSLISLIPGLIRKLQDCADPQFNSLEENMVLPTSLRTSERNSRTFP
jgi:hypothetical protein